MKSIFRYPLILIAIIFSLIIVSILLDTINAIIFHKSPIMSEYESFGDYGYVDRGIIIDTFYCNQSADLVFVSRKLNGTGFTCPEVEYEPMISMIDNVFVKTYTIEEVLEIDDDYQYWVVSDFNSEEKVKVKKLDEQIEKDKKYEIIFRIKSNKIKNNIKSIFEHSEIEYIKETEKDINQLIFN